MSARRALDFYETPQWMTGSLLMHHPIDRDATIIEPCAGDGAIVQALTLSGYQSVYSNDIDPQREARFTLDATLYDEWDVMTSETGGVDWIISNPPFAVAFPILLHAYRHARVGVAMILRKSFTEPTVARGPWLAAQPPTHTIGLPRYSFTGNGKSDSVASDWFIWRKVAPSLKCHPIIIDHRAKDRELTGLF